MTTGDNLKTQLERKTVSVLDAHGILYQVFHSMQGMSTSRGEPTGAVFGFVRDVITLLSKLPTDYLFCAFDKPGPTFRHHLYSEYKANRSAMPDDLRPQLGYTRDFLVALGIESLELTGFEADDIMATIADQTENAGGRAILVTSDKDARQLISNKVILYNLRLQQYYGAPELLVDWKITPEQVVDFQTMVGDSSDNIPGIPLIGPKSAMELLSRFQTLEGVYQNIDQLTGKKKENIAAARETIGLSRQLVQLKRDVPLDIPWDKGLFRGIDPTRLTTLCQYFGFRSLLPKVKELVQKFGEFTCDVPLPSYLAPENSAVNNANWERGHLARTHSDLDPENSMVNNPSARTLFDLDSDSEVTNVGQFSKPLFQQQSILQVPYFMEDAGGTPAFPGGFENHPVVKRGVISELPLAESELPLPTFGSSRCNELLEEVAAKMPESHFDESAVDWKLVDTEEQLNELISLLEKQKVLSIDLETTDVHPRFASIVGIALCFESCRAWYIPVRGPLGSIVLDEVHVLSKLRPFLESPDIGKVGQNIKYDVIVLRGAGIRLSGVVFDTMVADYLLRTGERVHNLDELSEHYLDHETIKISELIGSGKNQKTMDQVPTRQVATYAGEDALVAWLLFPILLKQIKSDAKLFRLYQDIELPLIEMLVEMEYQGIAVNEEHFRNLSLIFNQRLEVLGEVIRDMVREVDPDPSFANDFNINSPKQMQRVLYDDLKLPVTKKTKTGRSTDIEVLEELAARHPLPEKIIEHRHLMKLLGTYTTPMLSLRHPKTGRIHASFNQVVTATGRLSSSNPNLQNIPIRTEEGKFIRQGFVPDSTMGFDAIVSCDYSQIELRMLAHFSRDANMMAAFIADNDIHTAVASQLFNVSASQVSSEMRRKAKAVNFGLVYGQSSFGLSKAIDITKGEASTYIHSFFETYPGIPKFFDGVLADCYRNGYVKTILGRKRRIEGVRYSRRGLQLNMAERMAINTVIQGSAADLMKLAMVKVYRRLDDKEHYTPTKVRLLLQIHDELVFETSTAFAPLLINIVREEMELGQPLTIPLKVDAEIGPNWGEQK